MKRTYPRLLGDIVAEALKSAGLENTEREHRAAYLWSEVVGPGINRYTVRRYVDHGVMHVYLSSPALKNELSFHRSRLIEAINAAVGADVISAIEFH